MSRLWSDDEIAAIRHIYETAGSSEEMALRALADRLGRTYASVTVKASRLGLTSFERRKVAIPQGRAAPKFTTDAERRAATGARVKQMWAEQAHPRGALGMKHAPAVLSVISAKSKAAWQAPGSSHRTEKATQGRSDNTMRQMLTRPAEKQHSRGKGGRRADLGDRYFRSSWEANYARWLNLLVQQGNIVGWTYEPETFIFHTIKRGCRTYTPDFRIELNGGGHEWHEVKGWMDPKSKTRLDRMARHYPEERVIVIGADWFRDANRKGLGRLLTGWESGK
jgi:hypothetical protein